MDEEVRWEEVGLEEVELEEEEEEVVVVVVSLVTVEAAEASKEQETGNVQTRRVGI